MAAIRFSDVNKTYRGGHIAVRDLDLEIEDGEFLVLVGPVRMRQVDGAAHDRRPRGDHRAG